MLVLGGSDLVHPWIFCNIQAQLLGVKLLKTPDDCRPPAAVTSVGRLTLARWHANRRLRAATMLSGGKHLDHAGDIEELFRARLCGSVANGSK